jgi:hypothetical protein
MLHAISHVDWLINLGHQFEVTDALANGDTELMGVDHAGKSPAASLPLPGDGEQILVSRDQNSTKYRGAFQ